MQETTLHADLKEIFRLEGGLTEQWVDGFLIDVVRDDMLIEIQTKNLGALKKKLGALLDNHPIRVVHPIALKKNIVLQDVDGKIVRRRRSPKKGKLEDLFTELVYIARWITHANFSLEIVITTEDEFRVQDGNGSWRRKGVSILDRKLVKIHERHLFCKPDDYLPLLPNTLADQFTNRQLAESKFFSTRLATKMTYTFVQMEILEIAGKKGRANSFQLRAEKRRGLHG